MEKEELKIEVLFIQIGKLNRFVGYMKKYLVLDVLDLRG